MTSTKKPLESIPDTSSDQLTRFIFDDTDIRGELVSLEKTISDINDIHHYPLPIQQLLGEFLAAAALLSSTLKFAGIMTIQARGNGDVPLIMAEVSHQKKVRAIAQFSDTATLSQRSLSSLIGQGVLSIIIDPDKGERYQGIVPLEADDLAQCLEHYFQQSEQLPTRIWLASNEEKAGGLLLQRLPQQIASQTTNDDIWETQTHMASTLQNNEILNLEHSVLLTRLFHETGVRVFEPETIQFGCSCSKTRSSKTLKHLDKSELENIIQEEGKLTVDCHFCGFRYEYHQQDIDDLFARETHH